jgi:hypothetical protein
MEKEKLRERKLLNGGLYYLPPKKSYCKVQVYQDSENQVI